MMWKEFSFQGTYKWINIYKTLIAKYNNTYHKTIRMAPNDVYFLNESLRLDTVYNHLKITDRPKFKVDDYVMIM